MSTTRTLRVELMHFLRELLRDRKIMAGRLDSRLTGPAPVNAAETGDFDPSMTDIRPPYTAMFNQYVSHELGYKTDATYYLFRRRHPALGLRHAE